MKHFERFMFCLFVCYHWWPLRTVYTTFHSHPSHLFPFTSMQLFCCQSPAASTSFRSSFRLSVLLWDELECRLSEPGIKPLIFFGTQPALSTALHNWHSHWRQCVFHRGLMGICEVFPNKKKYLWGQTNPCPLTATCLYVIHRGSAGKQVCWFKSQSSLNQRLV